MLTTTPQLMEWCAIESCPRPRTAPSPTCSPSTVRRGTLWPWHLVLIERLVSFTPNPSHKSLNQLTQITNHEFVLCTIGSPRCKRSELQLSRRCAFIFYLWSSFHNSISTVVTHCDAPCKSFLAICQHTYTHRLILVFYYYFTVNCLLPQSPCLWSYKSWDKIQTCLFSRHMCQWQLCKEISKRIHPPKLSAVTDLLTTHHAAVGCSRCVVDAPACVCVCLCVCACVVKTE